MILAGDIGGTKTVLGLFSQQHDGNLYCEHEQTFVSSAYQTFDSLLAEFVGSGTKISAACFGVAGPVVGQRCQTTNLPWLLDGAALMAHLGTGQVQLLNDLEAMAIGMLHLPDTDLLALNPHAQSQNGHIAVIAAGTGLGEAILYWNGERHLPMATEGGHCDFAPQTELQDRLLSYLRTLYPGHVSYERVLCGNGFSHIYDFLASQNFAPPCPAVPGGDEPGLDRNAIISRLGVAGEYPLCAETVRLFTEIYGAEAGNLALKALALGGVYIGGGIAPKILPLLQEERFMAAFKAKGRFNNLLDSLPVNVCLNPRAPLLGAAHYFAQ